MNRKYKSTQSQQKRVVGGLNWRTCRDKRIPRKIRRSGLLLLKNLLIIRNSRGRKAMDVELDRCSSFTILPAAKVMESADIKAASFDRLRLLTK